MIQSAYCKGYQLGNILEYCKIVAHMLINSYSYQYVFNLEEYSISGEPSETYISKVSDHSRG